MAKSQLRLGERELEAVAQPSFPHRPPTPDCQVDVATDSASLSLLSLDEKNNTRHRNYQGGTLTSRMPRVCLDNLIIKGVDELLASFMLKTTLFLTPGAKPGLC